MFLMLHYVGNNATLKWCCKSRMCIIQHGYTEHIFLFMLYTNPFWIGGNLDPTQTLPGQLAEFNLWKQEMTKEQLNTKTCSAQGSVVSINTLKEKGNIFKSFKTFPSCKSNNPDSVVG